MNICHSEHLQPSGQLFFNHSTHMFNIHIKNFMKISVFDSHNKVIKLIPFFFPLLLFCFLRFSPFVNPVTRKVTASLYICL